MAWNHASAFLSAAKLDKVLDIRGARDNIYDEVIRNGFQQYAVANRDLPEDERSPRPQ